MWIFPHQQAEKSLQNQHVLSILQVGSHQLQYRFFRTKKPKSHHKTNTFCPITPTFRHQKAKKSPFQQHVGSYNPKSHPSSTQPHWHTHTSLAVHETRSIPGPHIRKTDIHYRMPVCGGARGIRTPDLLIANETRYQLRHSPKDKYTLAPSEAFTQADHDQHGFAPKTARQNDR